MGTKENPGKFDCYANAKPDEPMFVLLARDPLAPYLLDIWAAMRGGYVLTAKEAFNRMMRTCGEKYPRNAADDEQALEALECKIAMREWAMKNRAKK